MQKVSGNVLHCGGCHCGGVRFEVQAPPDVTVWDCNCSICHMKRNTHFIVPGSCFRLTQGEDLLTLYQFETKTAKHLFCRVCGVQCFYVPRSNPDGYAVTVNCIDPGTLKSVTVKSYNGQDWEGSYAATGIQQCSKE